MEGLIDRLNERSGLARTGRAVNDGYITCTEHPVHRLLLSRVEPGEAHGVELAKACLVCSQEDIAQLSQAVAFRPQEITECLEHRTITGLVEVELHPEAVGLLHLHHGISSRHDHHHAYLVGIAHRGRKGIVVERPVGTFAEEADGAAKLKVMLYVGIFAARHLDDQLIQRIIIGTSRSSRKPAEAALHLAPHAHRLRLPLELLFLELILHTQQQLLPL